VLQIYIELWYLKLHTNTVYYINHISPYLPNNFAHISVHIIQPDLTSDCHLHWLVIFFRLKLQILAENEYLLCETTYSIDSPSFFLRNYVRTDASEGLAHATCCPPSMWCYAKTRLRVICWSKLHSVDRR